MKTPPLLLLAALIFWGWQSGLLIFGVVMGVILESPRFIKLRWDLSTDDFRRIWNFCVLLAGALALYVFSMNEGGGGFGALAHGHTAALSSMHTASTLARWIPMMFFLFVAAQNFSERETIPLTAISTGAVDSIECVLLKMGVDESEFTGTAAGGGGGRIHLYSAGFGSADINGHGPGASLFDSEPKE